MELLSQNCQIEICDHHNRNLKSYSKRPQSELGGVVGNP